MKRFHVAYHPEYLAYLFDFVEENQNQLLRPAAIQMVKVDTLPGRMITPLLTLEDAEAQQLLQALWNAGLRPNEGEGTPAATNAMKNHIADLRKLLKLK